MEPQMNADERRSEQRATRLSAFIRVHLRLLFVLLLVGCGSNKHPSTRPSGTYDRQEAALRDPFGYSPNKDNPDDISGGKIGELNRDAMRKDIDHVLNP